VDNIYSVSMYVWFLQAVEVIKMKTITRKDVVDDDDRGIGFQVNVDTIRS
jgi:hypothetical protein